MASSFRAIRNQFPALAQYNSDYAKIVFLLVLYCSYLPILQPQRRSAGTATALMFAEDHIRWRFNAPDPFLMH